MDTQLLHLEIDFHTFEFKIISASESNSFVPPLFVGHFCSPVTLKEPNHRSEITRQQLS